MRKRTNSNAVTIKSTNSNQPLGKCPIALVFFWQTVDFHWLDTPTCTAADWLRVGCRPALSEPR